MTTRASSVISLFNVLIFHMVFSFSRDILILFSVLYQCCQQRSDLISSSMFSSVSSSHLTRNTIHTNLNANSARNCIVLLPSCLMIPLPLYCCGALSYIICTVLLPAALICVRGRCCFHYIILLIGLDFWTN